ncbi:Uncharacterised protein [Acinetobacter baumannii]|nr:Uncharacterised protein [Acinetobacter baumannii]
MSMRVVKNGHRSRICPSSAPSPRSMAFSKAVSQPSHAGSIRRVWVQAKIQGIARRLSTPPSRRLAGRLPSGRRPSSCSGVARRKYSTNCGSSRTTLR